jgi:DNA-binding PadR family transcriptional regulator
MDYSGNKLTNVEIALLEIIKERSETTGYEIGQIIEERGYREWANIGKTSIYAGIKKLEGKKLISVQRIKKKAGKGPIPNNIRLTKSGESTLNEEIKQALLSQKNLSLYYLGIAGISLIKREIALETLHQREISDQNIIEEITRIFQAKGGDVMPPEAQALFEHPLLILKSDIHFLKNFITKLERKANGKD